jgi:hypothetical protein
VKCAGFKKCDSFSAAISPPQYALCSLIFSLEDLLRVLLESVRIEFQGQRGRIVCHPFLEHAIRIEKIACCPGFGFGTREN